MDEFTIFKKALKRTGAKLNIDFWPKLNEILIEDETNKISYWFRENELYAVDNNKEEF